MGLSRQRTGRTQKYAIYMIKSLNKKCFEKMDKNKF